MRGSETSANGVVVDDILVEGRIGSKNFLGEPAFLKKKVKQIFPLDFVKTLPNVRTASSDGVALEASLLKGNAGQIPSIFGAHGRGSARKKVISLPALDPWVNVGKSNGKTEAVDLG